jgi:DNA polymerase III delta prime subunit
MSSNISNKSSTEYFLNKIFGKELLSSVFFRVYTMNPVTELQLQGRLKQISDLAGVQVDSEVINGIIHSSNQDARNSILTLGLYLLKGRAEKDIGKRRKVDKEEIELEAEAYSKDSSIGIYHTIGKFLHNKSTTQ